MTAATQVARVREESRRLTGGAYTPLDYLVVRAPLLSMRAYRAIASAPPDARLASARGDQRIRDALAVGSAELLAAIDRAPSGRERSRLDASLLRYLIRMSTRPTPYGLFAGVGLGEWGSATDLRLDVGPRPTRTRVDMGRLVHWADEIERRPELRHSLRLVANPAAFERAGRTCLADRVASAEHPAGEVSVRATDVVRRLLRAARTPILHDALVETLADGAIQERRERIVGLVDALWAQGFLITELRPQLTTPNPARHLLRILGRAHAGNEAAARLRELLSAAHDLDRRASAPREPSYRALVARTSTLGPDAAAPALQVDSALALRGVTVSRHVGTEAARAAELLLRISPLRDGPPSLTAYRRAFLERYGPARAVPLLEVLDPERGLGPLDSVVDRGGRELDHARVDARHKTLLDLAARAAHDRRRSIDLDDATIALLELPRGSGGPDPETLELNVFVGARSAAALDAGDFTLVVAPNVGAAEAGRGLGRFADLLGERAERALRRSVPARDAGTDAIDAELVYMPTAARLANVAVRPAIHPYEIVVGATPGVAYDHVIPLDELALGIEHDRLVVWWSARRMRVQVHAGHMLNAFTAPPACRLLAEIGQDAVPQLVAFDWGPAEGLPFLPRVCAGRIVLRPAQWRLLPEERAAWLAAETRALLGGRIASWRTRWSAPRYMHIGPVDNRLLIDLRCPEHFGELRAALASPERETFVMQEALPAPGHHWLRGPGGVHAAELVIPLARRAVSSAPSSGGAPWRHSDHPSPSTRLRAPGSDWLYAKLYCPRSSEDDLLAAEIAPMCDRLVSEGIADSWFFIRYVDDASHLRIRMHGESAPLMERAMPELCRSAGRLIANGRCDRIVFDTYEREIERYGGDSGLRIAEAVFSADSRAVAAMLGLLARRALSLDRTALAMISLDRLLASLGMSERERTQHYARATDARHVVGEQYRRRKQELRSLLSDERTLASRPGGDVLLALLAQRYAAIAPIAASLTELRASAGNDFVAEWCASIAHLHCNRLLGASSQIESALFALLLRTREGLASTQSASARTVFA